MDAENDHTLCANPQHHDDDPHEQIVANNNNTHNLLLLVTLWIVWLSSALWKR
jgi:hypothetical protein